jgi:hypothetical protein
MLSIIVICLAVGAIFTGLYYIGTEYSAGTGFATIALGVAALICLATGQFDRFVESYRTEPEVRTVTVSDTVRQVVHDTVYITEEIEEIEIDDEYPAECDSIEDTVYVEVVSEVELTEDEVDTIAETVVYNQ